MNSLPKNESNDSRHDSFKWLLLSVLIACIIAGNYYFSDQAVALKIAVNIISGLLVLTVFSFTTNGQRFVQFVKEARVELRKVVWPTRQETIHTTLIVVVFVTITALFLWGVDSVLMWLVSILTGQRG